MGVNLLSDEFKGCVKITSLTHKLTFDGETKAHPVYRIRLDCLYYNDQNDRIATWISQYKSENGDEAFHQMSQEGYNDVIEKFIVESNSAAIEKTQNNIALVNQREPGVVLSDGRIIDGNRRYTCLRRLSKTHEEFNWFEAVILDTGLKSSRKQIKMLELAIQHGEEKKVDYNPIDRLVGIYQDLMKTELLTVEEYAESTNESVKEVRKRMEQAQILIDFLEHIGMPERYYIAREYQVANLFIDILPLLKKCRTDEERAKMKRSVFNNILMRTVGDGRKYIQNINRLIGMGLFTTYLKQQESVGEQIQTLLESEKPKTYQELIAFSEEHKMLGEQLRDTLDGSILKAKKRETKARPSQSVSKSITMLREVDTRIFPSLTQVEKEKLLDKVDQLSDRVSSMRSKLVVNDVKSDDADTTSSTYENAPESKKPEAIQATADEVIDKANGRITTYRIGTRIVDEPAIQCLNMNVAITNLIFYLEFKMEEPLPFQKNIAHYCVFFIDESGTVVSNKEDIVLAAQQIQRCSFSLNSNISAKKICYLVAQTPYDKKDELQMKIPFHIQMDFSADFDF